MGFKKAMKAAFGVGKAAGAAASPAFGVAKAATGTSSAKAALAAAKASGKTVGKSVAGWKTGTAPVSRPAIGEPPVVEGPPEAAVRGASLPSSGSIAQMLKRRGY